MTDTPGVTPSTAGALNDKIASIFTAVSDRPEKPQENDQGQQQTDQPAATDEVQPYGDPPEDDGYVPGENAQPEGDEPIEELRHLDKVYKVPASLKKSFEETRAAVTRTQQEFAVIRNAVEAERVAVQTTAAFNQQVSDLNNKIAQLESYKEQARKLDWSSLSLDQKVDLDRELRNVDSQIGELKGEIATRYQQHQQKFGQAVVAAVNETEKYMAQKVPGWDQEKGAALREYGTSLGIPKERLITGWFADPIATAALWKAQQWDALQASKPAIANKSTAAPPVIKPGSANPMPANVRENLAYRKAMKSATDSKSKEKIIEQRLARMFK